MLLGILIFILLLFRIILQIKGLFIIKRRKNKQMIDILLLLIPEVIPLKAINTMIDDNNNDLRVYVKCIFIYKLVFSLIVIFGIFTIFLD